MEGKIDFPIKRIVRQFNNNLLKSILEYVGFEMSLKTIVKINSNLKGYVEFIFKIHLDYLSDYKKILFNYESSKLNEILSLFKSFSRNEDLLWQSVTKLMSHLLFKKISNDSYIITIVLPIRDFNLFDRIAFVEALEINPTLKEINLKLVWDEIHEVSHDLNVLYSNPIFDEAAKLISDAIRTNTSLTVINLNNNKISAEGANYLSDALKKNTTLNEIKLDTNYISNKGSKYISDTLKTNTNFTFISLNHNKITDDGVKFISCALKTNTTLKRIDLENNYISDEGVKYISDALKTNTTLTRINLDTNYISDEGALHLSDALKTNTTLTVINLNNNKISHDLQKLIEQQLKNNLIN
jgi:Ran GTPase-activating protein (RanGAP) involved in mRNA processing and transport